MGVYIHTNPSQIWIFGEIATKYDSMVTGIFESAVGKVYLRGIYAR